MTLKDVRQSLRFLGLTIRKTEYGEYRVNFAGKAEETAYYADDLSDAYKTGVAMWTRRAAAERETAEQVEQQAGKIDFLGIVALLAMCLAFVCVLPLCVGILAGNGMLAGCSAITITVCTMLFFVIFMREGN